MCRCGLQDNERADSRHDGHATQNQEGATEEVEKYQQLAVGRRGRGKGIKPYPSSLARDDRANPTASMLS